MQVRKVISLMLVGLILLPPFQARGQAPDQRDLEGQAQYYLQRIVPPKAPAGELPPQRLKPGELLRVQPPVQPPAPPRQPEEISRVEKRAMEQLMPVKQFGYSFFYQPPSSFLPVEAVPVGPDYTIGPGDTIKIILWGSVQGEYNLTVDRNGQLDIPKVGVVYVGGLSYRQLQQVLEKEFTRQYTNFQMNVTLDNLRTIQIFVVGQARFPGTYSISSLSTVVNALFAAGGPSKSGTLRDIQVRRGGKVIVHFDMYDFLLQGDKRKDIRLRTEDVIFIPPIGRIAAIGTPKTPEEIAEELKSQALFDLMEEPSWSTWRQGEEVAQPKWRQEEAKKIMSGVDQVPLSKLQPPKGYEAQRIVSLKDHLSLNKLRPSEVNAYFQTRFGLTLQESLQKLMLSKRPEVQAGPVKVPAIYELKGEKTVSDLIRLAGGLGDTAYKGRVQVLRVKDRKEMVLFEDDLEKILTGRLANIPLVNGDFIKIFPVPQVIEKRVQIAGAVKNPGEFGLQPDMRVKDLIDYAGGLLMEADPKEGEITRVTLAPEGLETSRLYFSPRLAMLGKPPDNLVLKPNDYLFIRTLPDYTARLTVKIEGEVKFPGNYAIKKGETLSSVLARAGGFSDKAYPLGAVFTREEVRQVQKQQLKAAIDRLEAMVLSGAAQRAAGGLEAEEAKRAEVISRQQQMLLGTLRKVEPLGRVVIHLDDPERLRGTPDDIELREDDQLYVPQVPQTVNVVGAVFNPTGIIYTPYRSVSQYVTMAGGTTKIADDKEIYVIKVNGAAVSRKAFKWLGSSWDGTKYVYHFGGVSSLVLDPGDTIVVPEELERIYWLKEIKDIATIIGNIALTAGVVLVGLK